MADIAPAEKLLDLREVVWCQFGHRLRVPLLAVSLRPPGYGRSAGRHKNPYERLPSICQTSFGGNFLKSRKTIKSALELARRSDDDPIERRRQ
jgi:hypothetical protein